MHTAFGEALGPTTAVTSITLNPPVNSDEQLLRRYFEGDMAAREQLTRRYMPIARRVAGLYRNSPQPQEDLNQVAYLALLKAIDRFDPAAGGFAGFAYVCIRGELKRYFRDHPAGMRLGRELQERWLDVRNAQERLTGELGRIPTPKEVAADLRLDLDDVLETMDAHSASLPETLDAPVPALKGVMLSELVGKEDSGYATVEFATAIEPAYRALSARDRRILHLRFQEDLTQKEIGERLGISQMHVSRLLRRSLRTLHQASSSGDAVSR